MSECVTKGDVPAIDEGQANVEEAYLHASEEEKECRMRGDPQNNSRTLAGNHDEFEKEPCAQDGKKDPHEEPRPLREDRPSDGDGATHVNRGTFHILSTINR